MVTLTVYRAVVDHAPATACFASARRGARALCCCGVALLLGAACATDVSRAQLAAHLAALAHGGLAGALARDVPGPADAHIATDGPGGVDRPDRPADTGRDERSIHDDTARSDETPTFDPAG